MSSLGSRAAAIAGLSGAAGAGATWAATRPDGAAEHLGLLAAAGVAVLAAIATVRSVRRAGAGLRAVGDAVHQMAGGDLRVQLPAGPTSELAALSAALAQMAVRLAEMHGEWAGKCGELEDRAQAHAAKAAAHRHGLQSVHAACQDLRRNILGIQGLANLVLRDHARRLDAEGKMHLEEIRTAAQAMDSQIRDLLVMSRVGQPEESQLEVASRLQGASHG